MREYRLRNVQMDYPWIAKDADEYFTDDPFEVVVRLLDGTMVAYDDLTHMVRRLPSDSDHLSESEYLNEFAIRLHRRMAAKAMTQLTLSELTGISNVTLSNYLNRKTMPSIYNVYKIAKALGCSIEDFMYNK